ncbi:hypothetical protein [Hyalangium versicolor]|uniref:hypothetical protein n=1 Tax=Hyalangium versicolor TaxID=2861190 RepID=UPI001CCDBDE2|nr:hypothetical protein [Hyalangium versicolor]
MSERPLGEAQGLVPAPLVLAQLERWLRSSFAALQAMAEALGGPRLGAMTSVGREEFEQGLKWRLAKAFRQGELEARVIPRQEILRDRPVSKSSAPVPPAPSARSAEAESPEQTAVDAARQIQALQQAAEQRLALCELCQQG